MAGGAGRWKPRVALLQPHPGQLTTYAIFVRQKETGLLHFVPRSNPLKLQAPISVGGSKGNTPLKFVPTLTLCGNVV